MDRILDAARTGPRYLALPEIASTVVAAIQYRNSRNYQLHSYVVMPNHIHLLVTPHEDVSKILHSLKRFTARQSNQILGQTGQPFWQEETYDRLVRNETEFLRIARYIETNPVRAGLARTLEEFPWSSGRADCQSAAGCQPAPQR
jgi:REP element-mobilizing transposase RayT